MKELGCIIIDADAIAKKALDPGTTPYAKVVEYFGSTVHNTDILHEDKSINREVLRKLVFENPQHRRKLNEFTHNWIFWEIAKELWNNWHSLWGDDIVVLDAPLLFETGVLTWVTKCNIVVSSSSEIQLQRLMNRNKKLTEAEAHQMIRAQMSTAEKVARADFVLDNDGDLDSLRKQCEAVFKNLKQGIYHQSVQ